MIGKGMVEDIAEPDEKPSEVAIAIDKQTEALKANTEALMQTLHAVLTHAGVSATQTQEIIDAVIRSAPKPAIEAPACSYAVTVNRNGEGFIETLNITPVK